MTGAEHPGRPERGALRDALWTVRYVWNHPANRGARGRQLVRALTFQLRGRVLGRPTIVRVGRRSRMEVRPGQGHAGHVYANPTDLPEIRCWVARLQRGDLFVDVGASVGAYTLWALECGADVVSIEPNPASAAALRRNLALSGATATVLEVALADAPGRRMMTENLGVLNHLVLRPERAGVNVRETEVTTLDDVLGARTAAGVKIDVEGAEELVLRGARRALAERRIRLLQLEWNPLSGHLLGAERSGVAELLAEHGYTLHRPDLDGELHPVRDPSPGPDVFAVPDSR